jgi:hypothetical protein
MGLFTMRTYLKSVAVIALATCGTAHAYDYATHALVTDHAYRDSVLNPTNANTIVPVIGLDRLDLNYPFGFQGSQGQVSYFDEAAVTNPAVTLPPVTPFEYARPPEPQERAIYDILVNGGYVPGTTGVGIEEQVRSWLMRGTIREDDNDGRLLLDHGDWITADVRDQDPYGPIARAPKHFYDPIYDRAFDFQTLCNAYTCQKSIVWSLGRTDPLHPGSDTEDLSRRNHFTWQDARNNYWWALTLERIDPTTLTVQGKAADSSQERLGRLASTIHDLGHVVHLLQDTGQPQHVRNDSHAPPRVAMLFLPGEGLPDGAYEDFTEYRVQRDYPAAIANPIRGVGNSLVEMDETLPSANALPTVVLGQFNYYPGSGGSVQFSTPVKFFTTRHIETGTDNATVLTRRGLADFSNHSFFTAQTLPGFRECQPPESPSCTPTAGPTYTLPPNDVTTTGYALINQDSGAQANHRTIYLGEYTFPITDKVSPSYDASINELAAFGGKAPLVTKTIWSDTMPPTEAATFSASVGYVISYENMRYMADVMLPRTIGYSAGMINFFFRGRIQVDAPTDGLFALVDHALPHTVDANGYPHCSTTVLGASGEPDLCDSSSIFGFTKVRVKIHNNTPAITESGTTGPAIAQSMSATTATPGASGPRLVAVARYHRNLCYGATLQGEAVVNYLGVTTENNCAAGNRTNYQEISVSKPAAMSSTDLNGTTSMPIAFDFSSDPIPINATDLFIQVVYRGQLGDEPDGIAVGSIDVREPTYITLWNNSDYAGCNGAWVTANAPGCTYSNNSIGKGILTAFMCIGGQSVYSRVSTGGNGNILLGKYVRLAALLDNQSHKTRANLIVGTESLAVKVDRTITGQTRQASMEIETIAQPYVPDPMFTKRGMVGSFRPIPFYLVIGTDPQPTNDMGALDVGALPPSFGVVAPDTGGILNFPNAPPNPVPGCTSP